MPRWTSPRRSTSRDAARDVRARSATNSARDLCASLREAMAAHGIDYVPGSAELGDFDPTSTTIAFAPGGAPTLLPAGGRRRDVRALLAEFVERRDGRKEWDDYTPYELRIVGTFVRLGWRERAHALLDFFLAGRRPRRGTSGPRSSGATRGGRASSATCRTAGSRPTSSAPRSICSRTSATRTTRSWSRPAFRPAGSTRRAST